MEWNRSETLALAVANCAHCQGLGLRASDGVKAMQPCNCVLRNIFRACFARFKECEFRERFISRASLVATHGAQNKSSWSRKDEEYIADFCLVSRRSLSEAEHKIFRYHYLLGADWRLCCRKLKMDKGTFFHTIYRIEQRLGRIFRELEPFCLYPLEEYFHGEPKAVMCTSIASARKAQPLRPPVGRPSTLNFPVSRAA